MQVILFGKRSPEALEGERGEEGKNAGMERIGKQVTAAGNGSVLLGPLDMVRVDSHPAPQRGEDIALCVFQVLFLIG